MTIFVKYTNEKISPCILFIILTTIIYYSYIEYHLSYFSYKLAIARLSTSS